MELTRPCRGVTSGISTNAAVKQGAGVAERGFFFQNLMTMSRRLGLGWDSYFGLKD
jgi:hypothetical protein